jgi:hypothetical protein
MSRLLVGMVAVAPKHLVMVVVPVVLVRLLLDHMVSTIGSVVEVAPFAYLSYLLHVNWCLRRLGQ